uniref:Sal-like protein 4 n=1 Tax=Myotis myotis TaxID=51298 RepID=A0A7J8ALT6_MYOMY|nr:hypothetical protein mMyoMyo1_007930 [Myotis myotis]
MLAPCPGTSKRNPSTSTWRKTRQAAAATARLEFAAPATEAPVMGEPGASVNSPGTGDDTNGDRAAVKMPRQEETHICEKCCGEFFSISEFLEHKENCTKHPPVLIMNHSAGPMPSEDFSRQAEPPATQSKHLGQSQGDGSSSGDMEEGSQGRSPSCTERRGPPCHPQPGT